MRHPIPALALAAMLAPTLAHADAAHDALIEFAKCANIADATARLKCFDAAVPAARNALGSAAEKAKEQASSVEQFGFARPPKPVLKPEDFGKPPMPPEEPKEITEITSTALEFAKTPYGRMLLVLDNGQVWRQLDADSTEVRDVARGTKITIERGFLGSYNLTIEGRNGLIKVTRLK
jgi:hypothetical protein